MAISSWMIWGRSLRTTTRQNQSRSNQERCNVQLDLSKGLEDNIKEILTNLCLCEGDTSVKKLGYLNAFVRLINDNDSCDYGLSMEDICCCLRVGLIQEVTQVRAATLRVIRYLLKKPEDIITINKLNYPYFITRSMDINLKNEIERMQALKLVRRILVLSPKHFSVVLARSLISLTDGGIEEKDRAFQVFLATLCELGVLNPSLFINCGGVGTLTRSIINNNLNSSMIESIIGVLLRLISYPDTRNNVSLLCIAAPYCELYTSSSNSSSSSSNSETLDSKFLSSKQALLSILRSYPGVIYFCHPNNNSGLKAIVDILYVEQLHVRGAVIELFYQLLGLTLPIWTDEPDIALASVDPSKQNDNWKLTDGFIAAEGKSILPSLASHCPNISELHLALIVYVLLECGLHRALAETIVTSDSFISIRAAILLGGLLHLTHSLLPPDVCDLTPALPNLLEPASIGRHQALAAVTILGRINSMLRRKLKPSSLFLDRILQAGTWLRPLIPRRQRTSSRNWLIKRTSPTTPLLKDAQVLSSKDELTWNWPLIRSILRSREDLIHIFHDSDHRLFIKRLIRYFKPSSNLYSNVDLITNSTLAKDSTLACCDLINCLLEIHEPEGIRLLNELIGDISEQINIIKTVQSAHDCLFSPRHMTTTCCQMYFLFIGQLSQSAKGTVILKSFNLLDKLEDLAIVTNHDCYVKLIISSLDYSREGPNRKVLSNIISKSTLEQTRLYATQFLHLIFRAKMIDATQWASNLIIQRLIDDSRTVSLAALDILQEICEEEKYLDDIYQKVQINRLWEKWINYLGDRGYLLMIRFYSLRTAFTKLPSPNEELEKWIKYNGFIDNYTTIMECLIHDSLTHRRRGENGHYIKRSTNKILLNKDIYILPHLIGQLVQHDMGLQLLIRRNVLQKFGRIIFKFQSENSLSSPPNNNNIHSNISIIDIESKFNKNHFLYFDDIHLMSEESIGIDDTPIDTFNRLETIIDSEIMETSECYTPKKSIDSNKKFHIINDSQRTTPEKNHSNSFHLDHDDNNDTIDIEEKLLKIKSAIWLLGHAGTSTAGVEQLKNLGLIELLITVAEKSQYYSLRATATYAMSLISTNRSGADALSLNNWPCIKYKRGEYCSVVPPTITYSTSSPIPIQKHHRSLSDGKPEISEPILHRRTRNRSESAATEVKRYAFPERGETPSPVSSIQRLSHQDAEGYAKLRTLQRHRRPSYSHSSLEMYSSDGRLSFQSLLDFESSRSSTTDNMMNPTTSSSITTPPPPPPPPLPPPLPPPIQREDDSVNTHYMGICLPKKLTNIFPQPCQSFSSPASDGSSSISTKSIIDSSHYDDEDDSDCDIGDDHSQICLVCYKSNSTKERNIYESDRKIKKEILRHTQRLSNPIWYRCSRQILLRLRQRYPEKFQDTCLYSEVATRLASGTYRLPARRFLQELFLDLTFDDLYIEPRNILKIPPISKTNIDENPVQSSLSGLSTDTFALAVSPSKRKINGRLTIPEIDPESSPVTVSQLKTDSVINVCSKSPELSSPEKLSDEKIIAEILKPAERLKISKSSDKILKVPSKNTAISLD